MEKTYIKTCIVCGKKFTKPKSCGLPDWFGSKRRPNGRRFCSKKCYNEWKKGKHFSPKTEFKKGQKAINPIRKGERRSPKTEFKKGQTPWNKGRKLTKEERKKISDALPKRLGEKAGNWRGGTTKLRVAIMGLKEYKKWRKAVFTRDNWTCQMCGRRRKRGDRVILHAHHIKPVYQIIKECGIKNTKDALKCKELWDVSNGMTLCVSCHKQTPSYLVNQHTMSSSA